MEKQEVLHICLCVRELASVWAPGGVGVFMRVRAGLVIQHATRMRHIVTSFMAPHARPHFSILFHKRRDFRKKIIEHKMLVLIFSTRFV